MFADLFKKKPLATLQGEAIALRERGELGEAKLAFDRLAERAKHQSPELAQEARAQSDACRNGLAARRIAEAKRLIGRHDHELARQELGHVADTAVDPALVEEAHAMLALLLQPAATDGVLPASQPDTGPSDEEALAVIMAGWSAAHARELEGYGEPLFEALLEAGRGNVEGALRSLRSLAARAPGAVYLQLELAQLLLASKQTHEAERALRTFLERAGDDDPEARFSAQRVLAQLRHDAGDAAGAEQVLMDACEAMLDDPRPYLDLGHYLRSLGRAAEAVEVLKLAVGAFPPGRAEWPVTMELGLALAQAGEREAALAALEASARTLQALGAPELPQALAAALAGLQAG